MTAKEKNAALIDETSIDFLKESLSRGFPGNLELQLVEMSQGNATMEITIREKHENIYHMVHGGVIYTLADTTAGFACRTFGCKVVTATSTIHYLNAAKQGTKRIYCKSNCIKKGRKLMVQQAEVYDDNDRLLASGTFTFCVIA